MSIDSDAVQRDNGKIKAVLFDFMGTCLDWHSSIISTLPVQISEDERSEFALQWRQRYFDANVARQAAGHPPEDIDITHLRTLNAFLEEKPANFRGLFTDEVREKAIKAWHHQRAWPDVKPALQSLKERGWEILVHANGTTRLQLDLCRSSGLEFEMLFSSELLGVYKPVLESYEKAVALLKYRPEECVMVAAHAYDTRGAKQAGMKTVYVYRWTDDINEDQEIVKGEFDAYLKDLTHLAQTIASLDE